MDIREIPIPTAIPKGRTVQAIFQLQEDLLNLYKGVEKLEQWPYDINSPKHQVTIKDFIARVVEELGEAYESYEKMFLQFHTVDGVKMSWYTPHVYNFNEEMADALHFLVETMIVTEVGVGQLINWDDHETHSQDMAEYDFYTNKKLRSKMARVIYPPALVSNREIQEEFKYLGGLDFRPSTRNLVRDGLWEVTYHLQLARNTLKNKPWKQTQMRSDLNKFQTHMIDAFWKFIIFCELIGLNEEALYVNYYRKNQVNQFRIRSKY